MKCKTQGQALWEDRGGYHVSNSSARLQERAPKWEIFCRILALYRTTRLSWSNWSWQPLVGLASQVVVYTANVRSICLTWGSLCRQDGYVIREMKDWHLLLLYKQWLGTSKFIRQSTKAFMWVAWHLGSMEHECLTLQSFRSHYHCSWARINTARLAYHGSSMRPRHPVTILLIHARDQYCWNEEASDLVIQWKSFWSSRS